MCGKEKLPNDIKKRVEANHIGGVKFDVTVVVILQTAETQVGGKMENDDCKAFIRAMIIKMISMSISGKGEAQ